MNTSHLQAVSSPSDRGLTPAEHILYRVNDLLPDDQQVSFVAPETLASDALRLMKRTGFSQLPVVQNGEVIGVFSHRSFADGVLELEGENRLNAEQLPVFDFLEQLVFADVNADADEIIDRLDQDNAVLVGNSSNLVGIATPMDALRYFHRVTSAFLLLQEIERAIRILLQRAFSDAELSAAIARCTRRDARQRVETQVTIERLSFGHYVQIIGDRESWAHLQAVFGTSRELVLAKLRPINQLRNEAFHFRREFEREDYDRLIAARGWLRLRLKVASRAEVTST